MNEGTKTVSEEKERRDSLEQYLAEIRRYKLLTHEQQLDLAIQFKEHGDKEAEKMLVHCNLRLVVKIAMEFQRTWMDNLLDLIQEGNMGLMQAAVKFDRFKKVKFHYYASFWIKAYILDFIIKNWRLVKLGTTQTQRKLFWQLNKEREKLEEMGINPTAKVIAERLGVKEKEVVEMSGRLFGYDTSFNTPAHEGGSETLEDKWSSDFDIEEVVAKKEQKINWAELTSHFRKTLSERELYIFDNRMCTTEDPMILKDIGDRFGVNRETVRNIEKRIKKKLAAFNVDGDYSSLSN